jgi:hypothetical protein
MVENLEDGSPSSVLLRSISPKKNAKKIKEKFPTPNKIVENVEGEDSADRISFSRGGRLNINTAGLPLKEGQGTLHIMTEESLENNSNENIEPKFYNSKITPQKIASIRQKK